MPGLEGGVVRREPEEARREGGRKIGRLLTAVPY